MRISIIAVGRMKNASLRSTAEEYIKRIRRYVPIEILELKEERSHSASDAGRARSKEAERIRNHLKGGCLVALDERGNLLSSEEFSRFLRNFILGREKDARICFAIGGPTGLDGGLVGEADLVLSLSRMTLPHELARVVLLEQIYRAMTIIREEPYHKNFR
ncbi:MAG: 23S rRNA (pseudouridine(1915)-N(3))-methyltransferase RlmH [bacterium]